MVSGCVYACVGLSVCVCMFLVIAGIHLAHLQVCYLEGQKARVECVRLDPGKQCSAHGSPFHAENARLNMYMIYLFILIKAGKLHRD